MKSKDQTRRRASALIALLCLSVIAVGCSPKPPYELDKHFSINVAKTKIKEKHIKRFTPVEQEIYNKFGPPDWMRILWTPDGELSSRHKEHLRVLYKTDREIERAWVYYERGKEVWFLGDLDYKLQDIDDKVRTICQIGDPERTERQELGADAYRDKWTYYSRGERYYFNMYGEMTSKELFKKMPGRIPE